MAKDEKVEVRVSAETKESMRREAAALGLTVSAYLVMLHQTRRRSDPRTYNPMWRLLEPKATRRAVPYVRVALADGGRDAADRQIAQIRSYASEVALDDARWEQYADIGVSGLCPPEERPGLSKLIEDARAGQFDVVVSADAARLGRGILSMVGTIEALRAAGVAVVLAREGVDMSTPMGQLFVNTLLSAAAIEAESLENDD